MKRVLERLVVTVASDPGPDGTAGCSCHLWAEVSGGRVLLLDDRGWGTTAAWSEVTEEGIVKDSLVVTGPDEPWGDMTQDDATAFHFADLARRAAHRGLTVTATELEDLPIEVELSEELRSRLRR
ncbi:hypothetical protein [Kytococcus sedentarius]|uniref:hypothetical protein n=1 Tax=Kytococcus sedentarius TaxID=1276 RepID=UPI0035BBA35F